MSAISNSNTSIHNTADNTAQRTTTSESTQKSGKAAAFDRNGAVGSASYDSVEISDTARALLEESKTIAAEKPWSYMEPKKVLVRDSKEEQEFNDLMKNVKSQKSDITSRINDLLKKKGLDITGQGNMKLEVGSDGKLVVGGLRDKELQKAVAAALNEDKSLAKNIKEYQTDEKKLSGLVRDYTGCSLYELTMTASGDINRRIRDHVDSLSGDNPPRDEFYHNLGFLGETTSVINLADVNSLTFGGDIDFSGEINTMAEPERNIKDSMNNLADKITEKFGALNEDVVKRLEESGVALTEDMKSQLLLNLANVNISVDNNGEVVVDGMLAEDQATHDKGVAIIKQLVSEMLNDYDSNSYHVSVFADASSHLLDKYGSESGKGLGSRVIAELTHGRAGKVKVA